MNRKLRVEIFRSVLRNRKKITADLSFYCRDFVPWNFLVKIHIQYIIKFVRNFVWRLHTSWLIIQNCTDRQTMIASKQCQNSKFKIKDEISTFELRYHLSNWRVSIVREFRRIITHLMRRITEWIRINSNSDNNNVNTKKWIWMIELKKLSLIRWINLQ